MDIGEHEPYHEGAASFEHFLETEERRGDPRLNEDQGVYREDGKYISAAIFDGATSIGAIPKYFRDIGKSPGRYAAETARDTFQGLSIDTAPKEALLEINKKLRGVSKDLPLPENEKADLFTSTGTVMKIEKEKGVLKFAHVGDCVLIVIHADGSHEILTSDQLLPFEAKVIAAARRKGQEKDDNIVDFADPEIFALISANRNMENHPSGQGYGALKGGSDADMEKYIEAGAVNLKAGDRIYILSDGVMPPAETPEQQTKLMVDILRRTGGAGLLRETRSIQDQDPKLILPRLKQYDDATYIEIAYK